MMGGRRAISIVGHARLTEAGLVHYDLYLSDTHVGGISAIGLAEQDPG